MCILKRMMKPKSLGGDWLFVMYRNKLVVVECAWCGMHIGALDSGLLQRAQAIHQRFCKRKPYVLSA